MATGGTDYRSWRSENDRTTELLVVRSIMQQQQLSARMVECRFALQFSARSAIIENRKIRFSKTNIVMPDDAPVFYETIKNSGFEFDSGEEWMYANDSQLCGIVDSLIKYIETTFT